MLLSSDFTMRMTGPVDGYRIPEDKNKTHDYQMDIVLKRIGKQQTFLDISRCPLLSSHFLNREIPKSCTNLLYLDISYTNCNDLSGIFQYCPFLKVLNLAGLTLLEEHIHGIECLSDLEVISMRESNITDISALSSLWLLRSIDLGKMQIKQLKNGLNDKERLEEILLDGCITELISEFIVAMSKMKRLKLVNLHEGAFALKRAQLSRSLEFPIYFEPYARRLMFFDAVVKNDHKAVYRFVTSGQDINVKAQPRDQSYFKEVFYSRCIYSKTNLRTPYFLCHEQSEESLRPNALHLAIFFNCTECVQILIDANIDKSAQVYIVEVMENPNDSEGLIEDPNPIKLTSIGMSKSLNKLINSGSKKQKALESNVLGGNGGNGGTEEVEKKVFTPIELVQHMYDKNVHRLTEDMVNQKVTNWKAVCEQYRKRLQYIVDPASRVETNSKKKKPVNDNATDSIAATTTEDGTMSGDESNSRKSMDFDEMMHRKSFAVQLEIDGGKSSVDLQEEAVAQRVARMIDMENSDSRPTTSATAGNGKGTSKRTVSFAANVDSKKNEGNKRVSAYTMLTGKESGESGDTFDDFEGDGMNSDNFKAMTLVKNFHNPFHNHPSSHNEGSSNQQQETNSDGSSMKDKSKPQLLPKKHRLIDWRDHGLVYKLIGQTSIYQVPKDPTISDNWMSMFASSSKTLPTSNSNGALILTDESPTSTKPSTPALTSRPGSRASLYGSRKSSASGKKTPSFGPLERLRTMSIKGLTLESDPNDIPFSHVLSRSASRPQTATQPTDISITGKDNDDDDDASSRKSSRSGRSRESSRKSVEDNENSQKPMSTTTKDTEVVSLEVLGKKSYWLESKALATQEKLKIMEEVYRKQQEIDRNTEYKDGRIKRIPKKRNTMEARRQVFMEYLQNRIESKFDHLDKDD